MNRSNAFSYCFKRHFAFLSAAALILTMAALPNAIHAVPLDVSALAKVPIQHEGRIKPLDTFARVHLLYFYGSRSLPDASALEWLVEVLMDPARADERPLFNINNPDVLTALNLESRTGNKFSFNEAAQAVQSVYTMITELHKKKSEELTPAQTQLTELHLKLMRYAEIRASLSLLRPDFIIQTDRLAGELKLQPRTRLPFMIVQRKRSAVEELTKRLPPDTRKEPNDYEKDLMNFAQKLERYSQDSGSEILRIVPPQWGENMDAWNSPWSVVNIGQGSPRSARYFALWTDLAEAYTSQNAEKFQTVSVDIKNYSSEASQNFVSGWILTLETLYNRANLFRYSLVLYIIAFFVLAASWIVWPGRLRKIALASLAIGCILQGVGILTRVVIMARPPVATLYESIIFVGFIAALFAALYERGRSDGLGVFIGSLIGSVLHFMALGYAEDGDSMGMLAAVLNTNFWLATHVVTIAIGYSACFVAGTLGHIYLVFRILKPEAAEKQLELYRNMVGVTLAALLFTIIGTVTGGIWADQSWGRFWGWDPKENGALLICLWLIWLLHARHAVYVKECGYAVGMIVTNIIVALAWFGVNLLNVGLHSYGFTSNIAVNLSSFIVFELLFAGIGYLAATKRIQFGRGAA